MARQSPDAEMLDLHERIRSDSAFDRVRMSGMRLVGGVGSYSPKVLVVDSAPGAVEKTNGRAFTGASGTILRSLIVDVAEFPLEDVWMTYAVKYWGGERAGVAEVEAARPHLRAEWRILGGPKLIVAVGTSAFCALRPGDEPFIRHVGEPVELKGGVTLWGQHSPVLGQVYPDRRDEMERQWEIMGAWYKEGQR